MAVTVWIIVTPSPVKDNVPTRSRIALQFHSKAIQSCFLIFTTDVTEPVELSCFKRISDSVRINSYHTACNHKQPKLSHVSHLTSLRNHSTSSFTILVTTLRPLNRFNNLIVFRANQSYSVNLAETHDALRVNHYDGARRAIRQP